MFEIGSPPPAPPRFSFLVLVLNFGEKIGRWRWYFHEVVRKFGRRSNLDRVVPISKNEKPGGSFWGIIHLWSTCDQITKLSHEEIAKLPNFELTIPWIMSKFPWDPKKCQSPDVKFRHVTKKLTNPGVKFWHGPKSWQTLGSSFDRIPKVVKPDPKVDRSRIDEFDTFLGIPGISRICRNLSNLVKKSEIWGGSFFWLFLGFFEFFWGPPQKFVCHDVIHLRFFTFWDHLCVESWKRQICQNRIFNHPDCAFFERDEEGLFRCATCHKKVSKMVPGVKFWQKPGNHWTREFFETKKTWNLGSAHKRNLTFRHKQKRTWRSNLWNSRPSLRLSRPTIPARYKVLLYLVPCKCPIG